MIRTLFSLRLPLSSGLFIYFYFFQMALCELTIEILSNQTSLEGSHLFTSSGEPWNSCGIAAIDKLRKLLVLIRTPTVALWGFYESWWSCLLRSIWFKTGLCAQPVPKRNLVYLDTSQHGCGRAQTSIEWRFERMWYAHPNDCWINWSMTSDKYYITLCSRRWTAGKTAHFEAVRLWVLHWS